MKVVSKILIILLVIAEIICLCGCDNKKSNKEITIVTTSFPCYDFARAIVGDSKDIKVEMLLKPGTELHDFEPTPKDIARIYESKMFIYVGGESDSWTKTILKNLDDSVKVIRLMDLVDLTKEEYKEGMEVQDYEDEYDEHVWTSPINAIKIVESLEKSISDINPNNKETYKRNSNNYIQDLYDIDYEIRDVVNKSQRKELIFADRFPIKYFTDEYGLTYYAAFPGCSEQTEASAKTISFLIDKIEKDNIPVVFKIELSNNNIARAVSEQTKVKVLQFNSGHNISKNDFDAGITYADIMRENIIVLKEALN